MSYSSNVTIDGVDIWDVYEAYIYKEGYNELLQWPALKSISGNDWQEHDGFEPDLSNPQLDSRDITITFVCNGGAGKIREFYNFLLTKPVMTFVAWITGAAVLITDYKYINWKELGKMIAVMLPCGAIRSPSSAQSCSPSAQMR